MQANKSLLQSVWTTYEGRPMHARISTAATSGPPVVLVHGLGVSGRYMVPLAERLAPFHPVYVPDLPGFGKSAHPPRALDIPQLTDALAAWLNLYHVADACLVGNSLGCQFIVDLALRYPRLIRWAVLIGPTLDPQARTLLAEVGRGALDMVGEPFAYWPLLLLEYLTAGPIRTVQTLRYALQDPIAAKLDKVQVPTLVIRGSRDPIAPPRWVEEMVRRLPHGQLLTLPGATHVANYTAPNRTAQAIQAFLAETHADGRGSASTALSAGTSGVP